MPPGAGPGRGRQFCHFSDLMATSDFGRPAMRSYQISLSGKYIRISVAEISSIDETSAAASALSFERAHAAYSSAGIP